MQSNTSDDGQWLTIVLPNGKDTDIRIKLAGVDSDVYRTAESKYINTAREKYLQGKGSLEGQQEAGIKVLAACTLEWEGITQDGQPVACKFETAYQLYKNSKLAFIREQVDQFINNRKNFLAVIEKNSESGQTGVSVS